MPSSWMYYLNYMDKVDECLLAARNVAPLQDLESAVLREEKPWLISEPWFPFLEKCIEECNDYRSMIMQRIEEGEEMATPQFYWGLMIRDIPTENQTLHDEIIMLDKLLGYLNRDLSRLMPDWYYSKVNHLIYQVDQIRSHSLDECYQKQLDIDRITSRQPVNQDEQEEWRRMEEEFERLDKLICFLENDKSRRTPLRFMVLLNFSPSEVDSDIVEIFWKARS